MKISLDNKSIYFIFAHHQSNNIHPGSLQSFSNLTKWLLIFQNICSYLALIISVKKCISNGKSWGVSLSITQLQFVFFTFQALQRCLQNDAIMAPTYTKHLCSVPLFTAFYGILLHPTAFYRFLPISWPLSDCRTDNGRITVG